MNYDKIPGRPQAVYDPLKDGYPYPKEICITHLARRPYEESVTHRFSSLKFTINPNASDDHGTVYWIEGTEDELFKFISSTVSPDITRDQFKRKYID